MRPATRARALPIELKEGPLGLALDEGRSRLYVLNRFSSSLSVVDTASETLVADVPLFDPTPRTVKDGRRHLYDTRLTSGWARPRARRAIRMRAWTGWPGISAILPEKWCKRP
jgi:Uncharacterized conserved protein